MIRDITKHVEGDENEISKAVKLLENEYLIVRDSLWYKITSSGIERYEQTLSPSAVNKRVTQRKLILEVLKELYDKNTEQDMEEKELSSKTRSDDRMELMGQVKFLDDNGLVHWQPFSSFLVRLTAEGALHFEKYEKHDYQSMSNAYRILFILENHLRDFLEKKLTDKFGTEWWEKGVSKGHVIKSTIKNVMKQNFHGKFLKRRVIWNTFNFQTCIESYKISGMYSNLYFPT